MGTTLVAALSGPVLIIEILIVVVVIAIGVAIFIMNKNKGKTKAPKQNAQAAPTSYYGDVSNLGGPPGSQPAAQQPQPGYGAPPANQFGGFAAPGAAPAAAPPAPAPAAAPPAPAPGTPAGWLPDPNGAADTLRYWDGTAWTQHVAARS